jgi:hypothetical protein
LTLDVNQKMSVAGNTAEIIANSCKKSSSCDGCAIGIANVYKSFDQYMANLVQDMLMSYHDRMVSTL